MSLLAVLRRISDVLVHSTMSRGEGGDPTARWQDKSRSLRLGRSGEERWHIRHLPRGATAHDSLPSRTTPCDFTTTRTSPTPRHA
jgi:hypothetical protein